jgi:hypothetical protein
MREFLPDFLSHPAADQKHGRRISYCKGSIGHRNGALDTSLRASAHLQKAGMPRFIADEMLKHLTVASQVGKTIVGGIDLNKARMRQVVDALIVLSPHPTALPPPMSPLGYAHSANKAHHSTAPVTPHMI